MNENAPESTPDGAGMLSFLERPASPASTSPWLLVLMHGVGSNEEDLFGLAPAVPPQFHVLSLRAPYVMGPSSYAWFQFSVGRDGSRVIDAVQERTSRKRVADAVQAHAKRLGIPSGRVVVGGFSQGGIMSLSLLLTQPQLLHAVLVMHSRLLPEAVADAAPAAALAGHKAWVSHGLQDNVIPLANAHAVRAYLEATPVDLSYAEFPGAHEIRPAELKAAMDWLGRL